MKRVYIVTAITSLLLLAASILAFRSRGAGTDLDSLVVGFIYENDESTTYTYNFARSELVLEEQYPDLKILSMSNVQDENTEEPLRELVREGCNLIFTNGHSDVFLEAAKEFPGIQFCQVSYYHTELPEELPENYHNFMGESYQGRYLTGIIAGMKLRELIDNGELAPEEALVGFVASFPYPEVISGYTAFLLGVRSVAPEAVMKVRYTYAWSNYNKEKAYAAELIKDGCVLLSQHTDTIGPAVACTEASGSRPVFHVGENRSMFDVVPAGELVACRTRWETYVCGAVEAMLEGRRIEKTVPGNVYGTQDMSGGIAEGWIELMGLNTNLCAEGTREKVEEATAGLKKGKLQVFKGDYTGVNPMDPTDTIDLRNGYRENQYSSYPSFHYVLDDVITIGE